MRGGGIAAMRAAVTILTFAVGALAKCPTTGNSGGGTEVEVLWDVPSVRDKTTQIVWSPLNDNHAFVVNQRGQVFARSKDGTLSTTILDIQEEVYAWHDRGMSALAFHPDYATNWLVYVFYAKQPAIPWADDSCTRSGEEYNDFRDFCGSNAAIRRLTVKPIYTGDVVTDYEPAVLGPILIEDWCSSSMTHHTGTIAFLSDKSMLATAGDGSQALGALDTGLTYDTCYRAGGDATRPQGSFRSQRMDFLSGKMIRILPGPLTLSTTALVNDTDYFIIAKGLRNPYRFAVHPTSGDVYIGDVGSSGEAAHEEINRLPNPVGATKLVANFGWPCIEGKVARFETQTWLTDHSEMNDEGCDAIWADPPDPLYLPPVFNYRNTINDPMDPDKPNSCATVDGAITGMTVYRNGPLSGLLGNKLIFCDYPKNCVVYFDNIGTSQVPDFTKPHVLTEGGLWTDVKYGPDGYLYIAGWAGGLIGVLQVTSASSVIVPVAKLMTLPTPADVSAGATLTFDASGSKNADNSAMTLYAWDFDGDGEADEVTAAATTMHTYPAAGVYTASVTVTNSYAASDCVETDVLVGITAEIEMEPASGEWELGDTVDFSLTVEGETVADADVLWGLVTKHCAIDTCTGVPACHDHSDNLIGTQTGLTGLSFKPIAHEMPSYVQLTANININGHVVARPFDTTAKTYSWTLRTVPPGFRMYSGESGIVCPFSNPPCTITMQAKNNLAVSSGRVQAMDSSIYAFSRYEVTQNGATTESTETQVTDSATDDGEVAAYYTKVAVTTSDTLAAPGNFTLVTDGYEQLTASWSKVSGAEYYIIYLTTTTANGLAHVPTSVYPTATAISYSESTVTLAVPDGTIDFVGSVAAYVHSTKQLGPRSENVTVRIMDSNNVCAAAEAECSYPSGGACTDAVTNDGRATGLGSFYDDRCAQGTSLPGCQSGATGCRACYWDRCAWSEANGDIDPGYVPDCPPCVAENYDVTKSAQTCEYKSSNGVDPNAAEATPAPTPASTAPTPDTGGGIGNYAVELRSCLVGVDSRDYTEGKSDGDDASYAVDLFQKLMELEFGHACIVSATGACDSTTFTRRRRRLATEEVTSGAEVTYQMVKLDSEARGTALAEGIIDGSLDGSLAIALQLGGLQSVIKVLTSLDYSVDTYSEDDGGGDGSSFGVGGIVAVCVVAAAITVLAVCVFVTRRRRSKLAKGMGPNRKSSMAPSAPVEVTTNPMVEGRR